MGEVTDYESYLAVQSRELPLPTARLYQQVANRSVLVTGATGCVGTALTRQLALLRPAKLVGIGVEPPPQPCPGEYHQVDIRNAGNLRELFARCRPDVVFHLAAQRDPGLAESLVAETVATNVVGTANVVEQSLAFGVEDLVYASTGKAMRPYTRDVYAASKKIAEWLVAAAGNGDRPAVTIARFTHVVDNSLVLQKFRGWCRSGEPLQLHDPEAQFYAQSAVEAAELLLGCLLVGRGGQPSLCAIQNLDWPFRLRDIADGVVHTEFADPTPLKVIGEQPGYEQGACPRLYDPDFSGGISPLINAMEGRALLDVDLPGVDVVGVSTSGQAKMDELLVELHEACMAAPGEDAIRSLLDRAARLLLDVTMAIVPDDVIGRVAQLMQHCDPTALSATHRVIRDGVRARVRSAEAAGRDGECGT